MNSSTLSWCNFIARSEFDLSDVGKSVGWHAEVVVRAVPASNRRRFTAFQCSQKSHLCQHVDWRSIVQHVFEKCDGQRATVAFSSRSDYRKPADRDRPLMADQGRSA
jgi:hypothetical protein